MGRLHSQPNAVSLLHKKLDLLNKNFTLEQSIIDTLILKDQLKIKKKLDALKNSSQVWGVSGKPTDEEIDSLVNSVLIKHPKSICPDSSFLLINRFLDYYFENRQEELLSILLDSTTKRKIAPFMESFKSKEEEVGILSDDASVAGAQAGIVGNMISTVGGLPVSTLADGLSQFMIERAKEELNIAFFQRMKKFFDKTPEIRVLFPKTSDVLENLLSYEYTTMLPTLRESFYQDLNNVFLKTDDVFKLPKYRDLLQEFPEIILCLKTMQTIAELDNESHPADVINDVTAIPEWHDQTLSKNFSPKLSNFKVSLQFANLISESLRIQMKEDKVVLKMDDLNDKFYVQV